MVIAYGRLALRTDNVYKPVAPNIGTVDGPFEYLTVAGVKLPLPFTTRMTVARLARGASLPALADQVRR